MPKSTTDKDLNYWQDNTYDNINGIVTELKNIQVTLNSFFLIVNGIIISSKYTLICAFILINQR